MIFEKEQVTYLNSILKDEITDIRQIPGSFSDKNRIYRLRTATADYLFKIFPMVQDIGEEDIFDTVYDCGVHALVGKILQTDMPFRHVLHMDDSNNNPFGERIVLLTYIPGSLASSVEDKTLVLDQILTTFKNLCQKSPESSSPVLIDPKTLAAVISGPEVDYLSSAYDVRKEMNYTNKALDFFRNDARVFAPEAYKSSLIDLVNSYNFKLPNKFCVIHADIKLANTIVTEGNKSVLIDWSRGHFGDPLVDFADIVINYFIYSEVSLGQLLSDGFVFLQKYCDDEADYKKRIDFYIRYKVFSISRVFYPDMLEQTCAALTSSSDILDLLQSQKWLKSIKF